MDTIQSNSQLPPKITRNWHVLSKLLKVQFSQLTKEDLTYETGKENELLNRISVRLNKKQEDVIAIIKENLPEKI